MDLQTVAEGRSPPLNDALARDERALNLELHHCTAVCYPFRFFFVFAHRPSISLTTSQMILMTMMTDNNDGGWMIMYRVVDNVLMSSDEN